MFSAHHLFVLDRCLEQLPADAALPRPLVRAATRLRRDAQETLSRHVTLQRKQLGELLSRNGGEWFWRSFRFSNLEFDIIFASF